MSGYEKEYMKIMKRVIDLLRTVDDPIALRLAAAYDEDVTQGKV